MLVNGYAIREALRRWIMRRDVAGKRFKESLFQFEGEKKFTPEEVAQDFETADNNVSVLETAQQRYNLEVEVKIAGKIHPLAFAIKKVGGAGRLDKMWRSAAVDSGRDRYSTRDMTRKNDEVYAKKMVGDADAMKHASRASLYSSAIREAIATGNGHELDMDLSPKLFE